MSNTNSEQSLYSDQENVWASQMAYCNIDNQLLDDVKSSLQTNDDVTFAQIAEYCLSNDVNYWYKDDPSAEAISFMVNAATSEYGNWKVVSVCDKNETTGLYALAIETGNYTRDGVDNGLMLAVRGSEATSQQWFLDYAVADANFINSDITIQEQELYAYIDGELTDLVREKHYSNIATTGHSLGGYLSFSAAAHMAASNPLLYSLFLQGTNLDGPGETEENLLANEDVYDLIRDKCTHYHYSTVGSILTSICEENGRYISIKGASDWQAYASQTTYTQNSFINASTYAQWNSLFAYITGNFTKHTLPSLQFDENGNFDMDAIAPPTYPQYNFSTNGTNNPLTGGLNLVMQASMYMLECWLVELENNDSGEDGLAWLVSGITKSADKNNIVQIIAGSLIETVCEEYYLVSGPDGLSEDFAALKNEVVEEGQSRGRILDCLKDLVTDYVFATSSLLSNNQQGANVNYWNTFLSDIVELKDAVVENISEQGDVVVSAGEVGRDILNMVGVVVKNNVYAASEIAREVTISTAEKCRNTIMAGTDSIITELESWDAYTQCINAQKQMTLNWDTHIQGIETNLQSFAGSGGNAISSLGDYASASLAFYTQCAVSYATYHRTGMIPQATAQHLNQLQQTMSNAGNQLLSDIYSMGLDGRQTLVEVGLLMKDGISDAFTYAYSLGKELIADAIVSAATSLYQFVEGLDITGIVDGWFLVAKDNNGATDVIYGVDGKIDLYGTEDAETLYGTDDDDQIHGLGGHDAIYGKAGNDTIFGNEGDDYLCGGDGTDYIHGNYGYDFLHGNNGEDWLYGDEGNDFIFGEEGTDHLFGGTGNDIIYGGENDDQITGENGDDSLYGEQGSDLIYGEAGDDNLTGGIDNDFLNGGIGADTYYFNLGDGQDTVFDYEPEMSSVDKIHFGAGISEEDIALIREGSDLIIVYSQYSNGEIRDSILVQDAYKYEWGTGKYFVECIEFEDGTVWDTETIANIANKLHGSNSADEIYGYSEAVGYHQDETIYGYGGNDYIDGVAGNDTINGGDGNDTLYGGIGDDFLAGGADNDALDGGRGSDIYYFNIGDGIDTVFDYEGETGGVDSILFGAGIAPSDVHMERIGDNLRVWYSSNDYFTVTDAYKIEYVTGHYFVENVLFSDGTVWNTEEIANRANKRFGTNSDDSISGYAEAVGYHQGETIHGLGGNDTIHGGNGNDIVYGDSENDTIYGDNGDDTLNGGIGNDHMDGGSGSDTFVFNIGDGVDTVFDYDGEMTSSDKISFGTGIVTSDVHMERQGDNLIVWYSQSDCFTVIDAYKYEWGTGKYFIETMEFADGTIWNTEDVANRACNLNGTGEDDTINGFAEAVGYHTSETIHGREGNDTINAGDGEDILYGDAGNDALYGENGNDTLNGGSGNDHMDGGYGNDTFVFNIGDGADTVFDFDPDMVSTDRIHFGSGISSSDVHMQRQGNDLQVWYTDNDSFTVLNAYLYEWGTGHYFVESMEFEDGTIWNTEDIASRASNLIGTIGDDTINGFAEAVGYHTSETIHGLEGNDTINAGDGEDILYGDAGNDALSGGNGNDILIGGTGNDHMDGGYGSDTYVFNIGDGTNTVFDYDPDMVSADKIQFGNGITASDVHMERQGNNLKVWYSENDSFTVLDAYQYEWGTGRFFVEIMEFEDGTVWNTNEIANRAGNLSGTEGNDTINGFAEAVGYHQDENIHGLEGNDTINAGDGNDILYGDEGDDVLYGGNGEDYLTGGTGSDYLDGGFGNDTYFFERGDGADTIYDFEDSFTSGKEDKIVFGSEIGIEDISIQRSGNELIVTYGENDQITIASAYQYYWGEGKYQIENVEFHDGTQAEIDYNAESLVVTYQPEPECALGEELSDGVSSLMAEAIDIETEQEVNLIIQEMSSPVEGNVSEHLTQEQPTVTTDELLWTE